MTTHYTPIVTGAPANASIVNAPLEELDAAIVTEAAQRAAGISAANVARVNGDELLDERMDNLVVGAGTSPAETVDARAAGNVSSPATTLSERIEWLEGAQNIYAAAFGFDDGNTNTVNATALNAAIDAAAAFAAPAVVWLPAGRFNLSNLTVDPNVLVRGARMPMYDDISALRGGTVLSGSQITLSSNSGLMDLGIEVTGDKNAISGGASNECLILNVATRGDTGGTLYGHGCVFTTGSRNVVRNFRAHYHIHGLVFKGNNNQADGIYAYQMGISCLTLAADAGADCYANTIRGLHADGAQWSGGIRIYQGTGHSVYGNIISGFQLHNCAFGVYMDANTPASEFCRYNRISSGIINATQHGGVQLGVGIATGEGADYNDFNDITVVGAGEWGFQNANGGAHNRLHACRSIDQAQTMTYGVWEKLDAGYYYPGGLMMHLRNTTTAQTLPNATWTNVTWDMEDYDPHGMHTAGSSDFGDFPLAATYRIRACIVFAANVTGSRMIRIWRSVSGSAFSQFGPEQCVMAGDLDADCQVVLEYITIATVAYDFRIQARQESGGNLTIQTTSHLTVELLRQ